MLQGHYCILKIVNVSTSPFHFPELLLGLSEPLSTVLQFSNMFGNLLFGFRDFLQSKVTVVVGRHKLCHGIHVASFDILRLLIISVIFGSTFFRSSNVYLVRLVASKPFNDPGNHPGSITNASPLEEEACSEKDVGDRGGKEGHGKAETSNRQAMEPSVVVTYVPSRPVSKNF